MSWLFSRVLVEGYLGGSCSDGEQSAPSNGNPIPQAYCVPDKMTAFSRLSRFGMTFAPLTADRGEELLKLYRVAFHAKTLVQQDEAQELTGSDQECGDRWRGSLAKYDPNTSSWKTHQGSLLGDLDEFSETWPQWGLMRGGECWEQQTLVRPINETESGLWPTPTASQMPCEGTQRIMRKKWLAGELSLEEASAVAGRDVRKAQGKVPIWPTPTCNMVSGGPNHNSPQVLAGNHGINLAGAVMKWPTPQASDNRNRGNADTPAIARRIAAGKQVMLTMTVSGGQLNPTWVEWLMGWPLGWTDLKPLATDKSHSAPQQHGDF